jgi:hypothetical protein
LLDVVEGTLQIGGDAVSDHTRSKARVLESLGYGSSRLAFALAAKTHDKA